MTLCGKDIVCPYVEYSVIFCIVIRLLSRCIYFQQTKIYKFPLLLLLLSLLLLCTLSHLETDLHKNRKVTATRLNVDIRAKIRTVSMRKPYTSILITQTQQPFSTTILTIVCELHAQHLCMIKIFRGGTSGGWGKGEQ